MDQGKTNEGIWRLEELHYLGQFTHVKQVH
jgi:hypothetical protein